MVGFGRLPLFITTLLFTLTVIQHRPFMNLATTQLQTWVHVMGDTYQEAPESVFPGMLSRL
jgi:hypothetical protein